MFLGRVIHFGEILGDQEKGRSPKKAKLVDGRSVCSTPERTGSKLQYEPHVKGRAPKKIKLLIAIPYVAHLIVQVLSFNMNLISSP